MHARELACSRSYAGVCRQPSTSTFVPTCPNAYADTVATACTINAVRACLPPQLTRVFVSARTCVAYVARHVDGAATISVMIVTVANFKGGVGKTTTTAYAAQILADHGYPVRCVDADRQGSLTDWHREAAANGSPFGFEMEPFSGRDGDGAAKAVGLASRIVGRDGHVFVDLAPGGRKDAIAVARMSAAVIIPTRPQVADWAQTRKMMDDLTKNAPGVPFYVLVTAARASTLGTRDIASLIYRDDLPAEEREVARYGLRPMIPLREGDTNDVFMSVAPRPRTALWLAYLDALTDLDALVSGKAPVPAGAAA